MTGGSPPAAPAAARAERQPPVGQGARPYELAWFGCDLKTGGIIEDLRALRPTGAISRKLGASTTSSFELTLAGAPADWEAATDEGRTMLVAVDTVTDLPLWAGIVLTREGGSSGTVQIGAATPETYLDRRYTADQVLIQRDGADVITALMTAPLTAGPRFVMDAPPLGRRFDFQAQDGDDRTVLSAMQELMGMAGGPEWTVDVAWADPSHTGFVLPVRVRTAIGAQSAQPEGTFDFPGCVSSYTLHESYEAGKGATVVQARGEGEGVGRLTSAVYSVDDLLRGGWPRWIYRFTPATGITDPAQLNAHAASALAGMKTGTRTWSVEAVASRAPRLGRDWALGDTVRIAVDHSPRHPRGADVVARAWSWELDPASDRVRPILVED
ncbi:hypothetical protein AB0A77_28265 [Streptomyces varsoviensis]|uniref:hypothetical protein n=1 Tax=Streptomyces varsoviensis TaxID=67373 RepID=UPI0033D13237